MNAAARQTAIAADQSVRRAIIDSMDREDVIEMIVCGLRNAEQLCGEHRFGGNSSNTLWRLLNGAKLVPRQSMRSSR